MQKNCPLHFLAKSQSQNYMLRLYDFFRLFLIKDLINPAQSGDHIRETGGGQR